MKTIGYVRVSTDKQADRGVSLEAQAEKIRAMGVVHNAELIDIIVDGGAEVPRGGWNMSHESPSRPPLPIANSAWYDPGMVERNRQSQPSTGDAAVAITKTTVPQITPFLPHCSFLVCLNRAAHPAAMPLHYIR
jgi:Resolvase, N terminal domain